MKEARTQALPEALLRELTPLREALKRRGTVAPVVGAGLSVPLKECPVEHRLPTWSGLLQELIARAPAGEQPGLARLLAAGDYPLAASELVHQLGRGAISTFIHARFAAPGFDRPSVYDALVGLPIDHFLSTNYDPFLGDAWSARHGRAAAIVTPRDPGVLGNLRVDALPFVLMLHGDARRPETCVLSAEDFARLQFGTLGYSSALASLAMQRRLLFIGHSLSDPDLSAILRECHAYAGDGAPLPHWFLGVDLGDAQRRRLAAHGVLAIEIARNGRFDLLETVLRELAEPAGEPVQVGATPDGGAKAPLPLPPVSVPPGGPFPGLLPFDEHHERFFCGREAETLDVLAFFRSPPAPSARWVQIEGASGAGKSSLLRAGVVPALRRGEVDGARGGWRVAVIKPGRRPLRGLATGLFETLGDRALTIDQIEEDLRRCPDRIATMLEAEKRLPAGARLVLAIDQFEEVFTFVNEESAEEKLDRQRFAERLAEALGEGCPRFHLVTTVRRDYLEHFVDLPALDAELGRAHRVNLPQMGREKLRSSIEESTRRARLSWDLQDLAATICDEAFAQTGGLASLGLLLSEMWERQRGRGDATLRSRDYEELNKVAGVLALRADELLERLRTRREGHRTWADGALAMLVAMVRRDRGSFDRRKPITRDEAVRYAGGGAIGENILAALSGAVPRDWQGEWPPAPRLVVVRDEAADPARNVEPLVEVSVEQLSRTWKTLDEAVAQHASDTVWRDRLESQAQAWHEAGRGVWRIETGPAFRIYERVGSEHRLAGDYLATGRAKRRKVRTILGVWGLLLVASAVFLWWHDWVRRRALQMDAEIAAVVSKLPTTWDEKDEVAVSWMREMAFFARASADPIAEVERWNRHADERLSSLERFLVRLDELVTEKLSESERWRHDNALILATAIRQWRVTGARFLEEGVAWARQVEDAAARYGRDEQRRRWDQLLASIQSDRAAHPYGRTKLEPRYDLVPLRQRASDRPNERVWELLVLGTGDEPRRDGEQGPWQVDERSGIVVALIPGGTFVMGAQQIDSTQPNFDASAQLDEQPHTVTLAPFYLAVHELTAAQRHRIAEEDDDAEDGRQPASVDWHKATAICAGLGGELPTEAQWEYACRAGTTTRYWSGDAIEDLARVAWFLGSVEQGLHPVGEKLDAAGPWGLFDMHGNALEWCSDWYGPYSEVAQQDPAGPRTGSAKVMRGGCCWQNAGHSRSACRGGNEPSFQFPTLGFRVTLPTTRNNVHSIFDR